MVSSGKEAKNATESSTMLRTASANTDEPKMSIVLRVRNFALISWSYHKADA